LTALLAEATDRRCEATLDVDRRSLDPLTPEGVTMSAPLVATLALALLDGRFEAGAPPGQGSGDPVDPMLVLVDRSEAAYTVYMAVEEGKPAAELAQLRSRVAQSKDAELVRWADFRTERQKYVDSRIVVDDYPDSNVRKGILELLRRYASTPFGLTWNGGIAVTFNDYQYTKRSYEARRSDPRAPGDRRGDDPSRDPNNPRARLRALLGWE
jgi:hypothetical protein